MQKLSDSELSIMMKIWGFEKPVYLEEIVESLEEFNWVESTIRNFLTRIVDKGYLKVEKDGRKNLYIPLVSKDYINKKGKGVIKNFYDNSLKKFVVELYESDSIDYDDLKELKDYLDEKIDYKDEEEIDKKQEEAKEIKDTKEVKQEKAKEKVVLKRLKNIL